MLEEVLQNAIEFLPDACICYDAAGRLVAWNLKFSDRYPEISEKLKRGAKRTDLVRDYARSQPSPIVNQGAEEWLRERLADIDAFRPAADRQLLDGSWIRATDRRWRYCLPNTKAR